MLKSSSSSPSLYQSNASVLASISAVDKAVCEKAMSGSGAKSDPENDPLCMSFKGEKSSSADSERKKIDKVSLAPLVLVLQSGYLSDQNAQIYYIIV